MLTWTLTGVFLLFDNYYGLGIDEFRSLVSRLGYGDIRVVKIDSHPLVVTRDYRSDRVNVEIQDGLVVYAYIG